MIKDLIKQYPNDADLGKAVRAQYGDDPVREVKMISQVCFICEAKFKGTVRIDVCPTCYV